MRYTIYSSNGTQRTQVNAIKLDSEWMGESKVTLSVHSAYPVLFALGDYLVFRGERFELNVLPTMQKKARIYTSGSAFCYDDIVFNSVADELVRCKFLDYVENGNNLTAFSSLPTFSFYCATPTALLERIQANLNRLYTGNKAWHINMVQGYEPADKEKNVSITVDNINCWEALALFNSEFDGMKFIVNGQTRTITVGTSGTIHRTISIGKGYGLKSIKKVTDSTQAIVTRLRAYGSSKNMPYHYYYYKCMHCSWQAASLFHEVLGAAVPYHFTNGYYLRINVGTPMTFLTNNAATGVFQASYIVKANGNSTIDSHNNDYVLYENGVISCPIRWALGQSIENNEISVSNLTIEITKGIDKAKVAASAKTFDYADATQLLATNNLMLPSFPATSLDPVVDDANGIQLYGIREESIIFDGSNSDLDEIYPTLEGVTLGDLNVAGFPVYYNDEDQDYDVEPLDVRIDAILAGAKKYPLGYDAAEDYSTAAAITDDGVFDAYSTLEITDANFLVRIRNIGFNLASADIKISDSAYPKLEMKDGSCGGRSFNIVDAKLSSDNKYYTLTCERVKDDSLGQFFPNKDSLISFDDHFAITNMYMPDEYVRIASGRLKSAAEAWLAANGTTIESKYEIELDNIYLRRDLDANGSNSIYWRMKAGDVLQFTDTDMGVDVAIPIKTLSITADSLVPKVSVTLEYDKQPTIIQRLQQAVSGIKDGKIKIQTNVQQTNDLIQNAIAALDLPNTYLSKKDDDTAFGNISFSQDIDVSGVIYTNTVQARTTGGIIELKDDVNVDGTLRPLEGAVFGTSDSTKAQSYSKNIRGCAIFWNGQGWEIETDYLRVNRKGYYKEIEINKVSHIGGQQLLTAANCIVEHVKHDDTYYYLFFRKVNGDGKSITNDWIVGDQAYCQTFNIAEGTTVNAENQYYWRLVSEVSSGVWKPTFLTSGDPVEDDDDVTFDPNEFHWIALSKTAYDNPITNDKSPCIYDNADYFSSVPKAGDNVVQLGCRASGQTERQGATIVSGSGTWGQAIIMFVGINSFTLPDPKIKISPSTVSITADELKIMVNGTATNVTNAFVATSDFAAIQSAFEDPQTHVITAASISTSIQNGVSTATITADQIVIEAGTDPLSDYFSVHNGDIWCQNITLVGVLNNLINVIDWDNETNKDKVIAEESGKYSLDILRLGNVIRIVSVPNGGNLYLPYYVRSNNGSTYNKFNHRTKTLYGGVEHDITPEELQQLIGKRITVFIESGQGGQYLFGALNISIHDLSTDYLQAIHDVAQTTPVLDIPSETHFFGIPLDNRVVTLEFKSGVFRTSNGTYIQGYYWAAIEGEVSMSGVSSDDDWSVSNEEEEEEE